MQHTQEVTQSEAELSLSHWYWAASVQMPRGRCWLTMYTVPKRAGIEIWSIQAMYLHPGM